jgi:uncharacterized membrane protein
MKATRRTRKRRGSVMIEFALLLPLFLFLILFSVDAGLMFLVKSELQDATQQAVRAGAQVGGAGLLCSDPGKTAFTTSVNGSVTLKAAGFEGGDPCSGISFDASICTDTPSGMYVSATTTYSHHLITPGLGSLLELATGTSNNLPGQFTMTANSSARCEVVING